MKRSTIILVGSGTVGKTTLAQRLKYKTFTPGGLTMTDGIEMSHLRIGDIDTLLLDFAGQKDYVHTHAIFFKKSAIYIAVFMPRSSGTFLELENYLQMIKDCSPHAPIILVTTRSDESVLSKEEIDQIMYQHSRILAVCPVDCKTGTGILDLEILLEKIILQQPDTVRKVPTVFFKFEELLSQFALEGRFSLSAEEFLRTGIDQFKLKIEAVELAKDLFSSVSMYIRSHF